MAKIFRLHKEGAHTITDWGISIKYGSNVINQIADPNGASASKEITSIPSPFARINLVKTAFKEVVESNNLAGTSIYHKMVSDSLDVGQIFFEIEKLKDQVEIIIWDKDNDLKALLNSSYPEHKLLGETYQVFLQQDAKTFNFDKMKRIYLLNFKNGNSKTNIIGATSPATLFFTSANDLSDISYKIRFGNDAPFDENYTPLFKRDIEYQKYWYLLQIIIPSFSALFPEVNSYLNESFKFLDEVNRNVIKDLSVKDIQNFEPISVDNAANLVEVLGTNLYKKVSKLNTIEDSSDFIIQSQKHINGLKPLVLPTSTFTHSYVYTSSHWEKNTKIPYKDSRALKDRILPNDGIKYPYLTISDFLEDTIVEMPYDINSSVFFDGNLDKSENKSYLLPVKQLFFEYFTPEQLMGKMSDGKNMFEIQQKVRSVLVKLRIPIKKGYIEYQRTYIENNQPNIDKDNNDGAVVIQKFTLALYSNIQFTKAQDAYYRVGIMPTEGSDENFTISFCLNEKSLSDMPQIVKSDGYAYPRCQIYVLDGSLFDYMKIIGNSASGIIVPKFKKQKGTDQYTFAIDFGTTNTHIEYSVNGNPSKAFDIVEKDRQIELLHTVIDDINRYIFDFDILPDFIGHDNEFSFPTRTALSTTKNANWNTSIFPIAHTNVAFPYEKRVEYDYNNIETGLKWSNEVDNRTKVKKYIESLFLILRNKVVLNNGNLEATRIVWFYPISMTRSRYNLFKQAWEEAYIKYFGENINNLIPMTESVAPYEYFKGTIPSANNIVNIDIGGGTSDIVIANSGEIKHITSFRFAADSIFGDSYASNQGSLQNGLIRQFKKHLKDTLEQSKLDDLVNVFKDLDNKNVSVNLASFFFSLKQNKRINKDNVSDSLDFNKLLQADDSQTIVFIIFYAAIIYHLAHIMKAKQLDMPRHITFSGNGAKVLQILTPDNKVLKDFTKLIFEEIFNAPYNENGLSIFYNADNPKEATCKGGISHQKVQDYTSIDNVKIVLRAVDMTSFVKEETYETIIKDDSYIEKVVTQLKDFLNFTFSLNKKFSFSNNFGLENQSLEIAKKECFRDLATYTHNGLNRKLEEVSKEDKIEETLFFYPLNGVLNALAAAIYDNKLNSHK